MKIASQQLLTTLPRRWTLRHSICANGTRPCRDTAQHDAQAVGVRVSSGAAAAPSTKCVVEKGVSQLWWRIELDTKKDTLSFGTNLEPVFNSGIDNDWYRTFAAEK
jgi:hypothetical protein